MGEDKRLRCRRRRHCRSGDREDRLSGLPDELLHDILVRLGSAAAAARTSVLSRRWRHVWAHLPELRIVVPPPAPTPFISTQQHGRDLGIPAVRIAPWLRFAVERVVGEHNLYLCVPPSQTFYGSTMKEAVLELPAWERAKRIELDLQYYTYTTWLRPQPSGLFTALTSLKIDGDVSMEGTDLSALVNTQCPCLKDLDLFITLIVNFDVLMHSNTLHTLKLKVLKARRLEVVAPRLEELTIFVKPMEETDIFAKPMETRIFAPKLLKVAWRGDYDPHLNQFVDAGLGHTLQLLKISSPALSLTKRFDEVDELNLNIYIDFPDAERYESFLNGTNKLPKCKSFSLYLYYEHHALVPIMLHLLRRCSSTKKFRVHLGRGDLCRDGSPPVKLACLPSCPCRLKESRKIDGIDLSSLEEVEISNFSGYQEQMELLEVVSSIAGILKRLVINDGFGRRPKEAREKVRTMCHPTVRVEFDD